MTIDRTSPEDAALAARLRALPVPAPTDGFFERALARAEEVDGGDEGREPASPLSRFHQRVSTGIAAVVIASVVAFFGHQSMAPGASIPEVTVAMNMETPVNVVFTSDVRLADARVSLQLPDGVRLAGHDGSSLSWTTDLAAGKNVLTLPLVASPTRGVGDRLLVARLEHENRTRTFQLKVVTL